MEKMICFNDKSITYQIFPKNVTTFDKHSFSTILYLCSLGRSFPLMNMIGCKFQPSSIPVSQASVCNTHSFDKLGFCRIGYDVGYFETNKYLLIEILLRKGQ